MSEDDRWSVENSEVVWENPYFEAGYDDVERPDGEVAQYYWIDPPDAVAVVAVEDGEVVLLEQYFARIGGWQPTVPGGGVDPDESYVEAGVRELREETGFVAGEAVLLDVVCPIAWTRMGLGIVYATDLEPGDHDRDPGEALRVETVPVGEAIDWVRDSTGIHGPGLTALLLASEEGLL